MERYEVRRKIGEGAFGEVYKAKHKLTGRVVALKRVRIPRLDDGLPLSLLREIQALAHVADTHIVPLYEHFAHGSSIVMSMELMYTDLHSMIKAVAARSRTLPMPAIKCIMQMLLRGVDAMHAAHLMHRDLKPSNLLFSAHGVLKIGDFGLARVYDARAKQPDYSHEVATRWYRAPELLYGARNYGPSVDLWAVGCIFAELLTSAPLFPGQNDIDQLYRVVRTLGSPNASNWPEVAQLPDFDKITFPQLKGTPLHQVLPDVDEAALDLLHHFIRYRAHQRLPAAQALTHRFFHAHPVACHPSELAAYLRMAVSTSGSGMKGGVQPRYGGGGTGEERLGGGGDNDFGDDDDDVQHDLFVEEDGSEEEETGGGGGRGTEVGGDDDEEDDDAEEEDVDEEEVVVLDASQEDEARANASIGAAHAT